MKHCRVLIWQVFGLLTHMPTWHLAFSISNTVGQKKRSLARYGNGQAGANFHAVCIENAMIGRCLGAWNAFLQPSFPLWCVVARGELSW